MRMPAGECDLHYAGIKNIGGMLLQHAHVPRQHSARQLGDGARFEQYRSRSGRNQSGHALQQCGFSHAVGAEQTPEVARSQFEIEIPNHFYAGNTQIEMTATQPCHDFSCALWRRSRKSGTPSKAVTTPTGSCRGASTVRASVSETTRKQPPKSVALGSNTR